MSKKRVKYLFFPFTVLIISSILVFLVIPGKKVQRPVHVDPETLKAYVGHYRVLPDFTVSITSRYGFLYYQPTTQSYGDKLLSKSETEFYLEEWGNTSIEFRKDSSEKERKIECVRYQILTSLMEEKSDKMDWQDGMELLRRVGFKGDFIMSCWSSVYDISARAVYITLHKKYLNPFKINL